jgi:HK97 family phage prohead protease
MTQNLMMVCEAKLVLEAKADNQQPTGKIEARVTTWGPREGADGRKFFYQPEGFMDWAKEFSSAGRPLPMFVNHAADAIPVGQWTEFAFDDEGMTASGQLFMNTSAGRDLYEVMRQSPEMFGGVSVGAYAEEYQWVKEDGSAMTVGSDNPYEDGYFQITKGGLREVSVVMYPNNMEATVSTLEFFRQDGTADLKILEKALREAGLSKKDAVTSASVFKKVLEQREVAPETIETAAAQSDSDAEVTASEILAALEQRELMKHLNQLLKD